MAFDRAQIKLKVAQLAAKGVFIGTSSWKYEGWLGTLYDEQRYINRGKVSEKRFEKYCLSEYAEVFKTVCVDGAYYKFPGEQYLTGLVAQVPADFQFAFKVTDAITIKKYANLRKFGARAGKPNEHFLDAGLFERAFLKPCEPFRKNVGLLIFEFSRFYSSDYEHSRDFVADLDKFLNAIPEGWPYAIEMRNSHWLQPDYFGCLARHGVAHVFNSWEAMPPVSEQMAMAGSRTNPNLCAARFLLAPGRKYEVAVKMFEGYKKVKEPYPEARYAGAKLIAEGKSAAGEKKTLIYVNNRLEGNALETIDAMLERVTAQEAGGTFG